MKSISLRRSMSVMAVVACAALGGAASASASPGIGPIHVTWVPGYKDPGNPAQGIPPTPAQYNKVGVIRIGSRWARNVLVLEPGTSAAGAYFVPLAKWIVSTLPGWQVWAVERRESLLEDQSVLNEGKAGTANDQQVFNYYLGWLKDSTISPHLEIPAASSVEFAKNWGMKVAVLDLHRVIEAAKQLGGKVVLGGHSLGGAVVTAYATWDFNGRPGAKDLAGLVYDDGGSLGTVDAATATQELAALNEPSTTPWLAFGGIPAPLAGIFAESGGLSALEYPNDPSIGQASGLLPSFIVPPVPVTNLAQFGYALNVATSPAALIASQAHLGVGLTASPTNGYYGWNGAGALTPIDRLAEMYAGWGVKDTGGVEWYFPQRLTYDTGAVNNGIANPAQSVLDVDSTMGDNLPKSLKIYAFGAIGGAAIGADAEALAAQSGIPSSNVTTLNYGGIYAHNDPAGAYPSNAFFNNLVPFLAKIARHGRGSRW